MSDSLRPHELQHTLSITNSQSLFKLMPFELVMPSNHLVLCHSLLLLPLIFSSIRVFPNELALHQEAKVLELVAEDTVKLIFLFY